MGLLDDLKHKAEELGEKAKGGLDTAKDKAGDLADDARHRASDVIDDVKERFGHHDESAPLGESSDIAADEGATGAVEPSAEDEPAVETEVDPFDEPLTESIGDSVDQTPSGSGQA